MRAVSIALVAWVGLTGCNVGPRVQSFLPAQRPEGVAARIVTRSNLLLRGEVLVVQDTALIIRGGDSLYFVPVAAIRQGTFAQLKEADIRRGAFVRKRAGRERLQLVSRFPQGISEDRLHALLGAYGQGALVVVPP
jgi:hypothetical protein